MVYSCIYILSHLWILRNRNTLLFWNEPQVHSSPSLVVHSVTVWHSLFHLSYIYDNVVYERYAKNIKYQNLSKKESK